MRTDPDRREAHGVPDCLDLEPALGHPDVIGYRCRVCGEPVYGTTDARQHGCVADDPCPICGSASAQPDVATDAGVAPGRVDECERCGTVFRNGGESDAV